jgi:cyclopropane fatty-acyl-phospholipid synthase-like methyltransferase
MKKKRIQAFYQERAVGWYSSPFFYGKDPLSKLYDLRETSLVRKSVEIHQDNLVLDIGCGPGRWVVEYAARGAKVIALDISAKTVKSSKLKTTKILGNWENLLE